MGTRPVVAIAHDYLTQRGGAERVVLTMAKAFPDAPIYTTLFDLEETYPQFSQLDVRTSPLNRLAVFRKNHRWALPFLPFVSRRTRIDADVVLCSSSGWSHGFRAAGRKVVYCYSPARWLYQSQRYLGDHSSGFSSIVLKVLGPYLRRWDRKAARTADEYVAISSVVQDRIMTAYGLPSVVVPAPRPNTSRHEAEPIQSVVDWLDGGTFEICVSRLLPYKNVGEIVEAYTQEPGRKLVMVGTGPELERLLEMATPNIMFLQNVSEGELAWLYEQCSALIAISYEDFGLTPLEAAAFGKPSLVLRWGGFLETMVENVTAVFIEAPTAADLRDGLGAVDGLPWDNSRIVEHAERYAEDLYIERIRAIVKAHLPTQT